MEDEGILRRGPGPATAPDAQRTRRTFLLFLIGIAAVGCLFVALALLKAPRTGVVVSTGRISEYRTHNGTGRRRRGRVKYASDVKALVKGTQEKVTVYYRVKDRAQIPKANDEIRFAYSWLTGGNTPYPQWGAVWTGVALLALDGAMCLVYLAIRRKKPAEPPQ